MKPLIVDVYQKCIESVAMWDIWLTVTFREAVSSEMAMKSFRYFFKNLNTPKAVFYRKYIRSVVVLEMNKNRTSSHIHCLIHGIAPSLAKDLERRCRGFFGISVAKIYNPLLPRLASEYMAEKCAEGDIEDWRIMKINSKWRGGKR